MVGAKDDLLCNKFVVKLLFDGVPGERGQNLFLLYAATQSFRGIPLRPKSNICLDSIVTP